MTGHITIPRALLEQWKQTVNTLAALSLKAERYEVGAKLKQSMADELAKPDRHTLQAAGTHPAPCVRHCDAPAFQNEILALKSEMEMHGCCETAEWAAGEIERLHAALRHVVRLYMVDDQAYNPDSEVESIVQRLLSNASFSREPERSGGESAGSDSYGGTDD